MGLGLGVRAGVGVRVGTQRVARRVQQLDEG